MTVEHLLKSFVLAAAILLISCGGDRVKIRTGPACELGEKSLRNKLGPELGKIIKRVPLARSSETPYGCAIVYTTIPEETADELESLNESAGRENQSLATVFFDPQGNPRFKRLSSNDPDANGLILDVTTKQITHDDFPEFVIEESGPETGEGIRYRGLRILDGAPGSGRQIFSKRLMMTTAEGLKVIPQWSLAIQPNSSKLILKGGGQTETYLWNRTRNRFISLNESQASPPMPTEVPASEKTETAPIELPDSTGP